MKHKLSTSLFYKSLSQVFLSIGICLFVVLNSSSSNAGDLEDLADAAIIGGSYAIPGSEFLTVLANADLIAIALLKVHLNTKIKEALIEGNDKKLAIAQDLMSKSQDTKVAKDNLHKKQGEDPWSARFNITSTGFSLPSTVGETVFGTAEIDSSLFRTASWVLPEVFNTDSPRQDPDGSLSFSATLLGSGDLEVALTDFSFSLPSFTVNMGSNTETGINLSEYSGGSFVAKDNGDGNFVFDFSTIGTLTNDIYNLSNPALDFVNANGRIFAGNTQQPPTILVSAQDTLLVPGPKSINESPIIYAAAQTSFSPSTQSIRFSAPTSGGQGIPIVAIDTLNRSFESIFNNSTEDIIGASLMMDDFLLLDNDGAKVYFSDAEFQITKNSTTMLSGVFTNISLDLISGLFVGDTIDVQQLVADSILSDFFGEKHQYQFMSPLNALYFYQLTDKFSGLLTEDVIHPHITFVNHNVPEPATVILLISGIGILSFYRINRSI